jgi:hypothetical protein
MSDTEVIILAKPKKARSEKQLAATAKLVAANKARREAKALEKSGGKAPEPVPAPVPVKKEETPIEEVIEKKPRKKYTRKAPVPPPQEHYLESESEEEEDLEPVQEIPLEPRSFRIPRHMRN